MQYQIKNSVPNVSIFLVKAVVFMSWLILTYFTTSLSYIFISFSFKVMKIYGSATTNSLCWVVKSLLYITDWKKQTLKS